MKAIDEDSDAAQAELCGQFGVSLGRAASDFIDRHPDIGPRAVATALGTLLTKVAVEGGMNRDAITRMIGTLWDLERARDPGSLQ